MTAKHFCLALNVRGNRRHNRRDPSFFVRVAVNADPTIRGHWNSVRWLTRTNRKPGGELPSNLCHRDKDYGNWNKNAPVFRIPVFIFWSLFSSWARLEEIESFWRQLIWRDSCKDAGRPGRRSLRFRAAALLDSATRRGRAALVLNPSRVNVIGVTPPFVKNCTLRPEITRGIGLYPGRLD